ncbi:MAG: 16S rRNA (cytidine(1402)-2'-O)-methyltransferase [Erysipelotrichaceae bacterium]|jgi:16S rRNA (cytidine1402-2'-O)-methyltransferase|nr:16S rRNA (cytidine(1402)-2'-O)-methyltransferase [Erysipelotrichaceae bacterium]
MKRSFSYTENKPILYLVATPIGNLKEFSPRAIETIIDSDLIACEDTRNTAKLLSFFDIHKKLFSLHEHNEVSASIKLVELIKTGMKVSYVSDAGFPAISDPGALLVKECLNNDINVSVVSGSNAMLMALVASGLPTDHFYFHGFLSAKNSDRKKELEKMREKEETLIFYESPHRIDETLKSMFEIFGDRETVIARELSKLHEEYIRGKLSELVELEKETLKGEMVILIDGKKEIEIEISPAEIINEFDKLEDKYTTKDKIELVAKSLKIKKNYVYRIINEKRAK